jgi:multiple sugar transport system substrate-binding protein
MSNGGGILSDDLTKIIIDDENSKKGLNFYADLRKKYHVAPKKEEAASATMAQLFLQQKIGMHLTGRWLVPKYREEADFRWDIVTFPKGKNGSIVSLDSSGWAVSRSSKHKDEAHKLVNYLSSKENSEKITKSGLIVPARNDVQNSKYFFDGQAPKNVQAFLDAAKTAKPTPVSVNYNEIIDNLNPKFEKLFN